MGGGCVIKKCNAANESIMRLSLDLDHNSRVDRHLVVIVNFQVCLSGIWTPFGR